MVDLIMSENIRFVNTESEHRYEIYVGGIQAGYTEYELLPGQVEFVHTQVEEQFEGQGLASKLAVFALDDVRARSLQVVAKCPYIARFIDRHPDYHDLLAAN